MNVTESIVPIIRLNAPEQAVSLRNEKGDDLRRPSLTKKENQKNHTQHQTATTYHQPQKTIESFDCTKVITTSITETFWSDVSAVAWL